MSAGEISLSGVQIRYFWSAVRVTRRTLRFRSRTRVEKSMPSSSGGFGSASQTAASAIAAKIARRVQRLRIADLTLILTFSLREKELVPGMRAKLPLPFSPLGREGRAAPSEGVFFTFRNPVSAIRNYLVTLIFTPSPRPFTLRSYIDSAKTGGTTKFPRLHDLIW